MLKKDHYSTMTEFASYKLACYLRSHRVTLLSSILCEFK
jgi:hypothetical protein